MMNKRVLFTTILTTIFLSSCFSPTQKKKRSSSETTSQTSITSETSSTSQTSLTSLTTSSLTPTSVLPSSSSSSIPVVHHFSSEYEASETHHWHKCLDEGCKEISGYEEHTFENGICSKCQYSYDPGYIKQPLSFVQSDVDSNVVQNAGDVNVLVLLINITLAEGATFPEGYYVNDFDMSDYYAIEHYYFGESESYEVPTLKEYYERLSMGELHINGLVSEPMEYSLNSSQAKTITTDRGFSLLYSMLLTLVDTIQNEHPEIDWSSYDTNHDGYFDAINFITNFYGADWAEPLWPHQSQIGTKLQNKLGINTYSLSSLEHTDDSQVAIHEVGHMFGIQDYYNYSMEKYPYGDYVGFLDVQSATEYMDWNCYSKMVAGWCEPTVYTGTKDVTTITLKSSTLHNDCLVVPASYENYNGSAFDEYFMFELINNGGNNKVMQEKYYEDENNYDHIYLENYGIRAYHVYAPYHAIATSGYRVVANKRFNSLEEYEAFKTEYKSMNVEPYVLTSNCADEKDYLGISTNYSNFQQLQLIQAEGERTFYPAQTSQAHQSFRNEDFFHEGDTFTFDKYNQFLTRDGSARTTTCEGEEFNYSIHFDHVSRDEFTVTITK